MHINGAAIITSPRKLHVYNLEILVDSSERLFMALVFIRLWYTYGFNISLIVLCPVLNVAYHLLSLLESKYLLSLKKNPSKHAWLILLIVHYRNLSS